jgi:hypothetical protein
VNVVVEKILYSSIVVAALFIILIKISPDEWADNEWVAALFVVPFLGGVLSAVVCVFIMIWR